MMKRLKPFIQRWGRWGILSIGLILGLYFAQLGLRLVLHTQAPFDGVLVLGGGVQREVYAIANASDLPRPLFISGGSPQDCIQRLFDRYQANPDGVWIEPCATSTFENFTFAAPLLEAHQVKHVLVITSAPHVFRANRLGKIMLGFRGIAVKTISVPEKGRSGNQESKLKTTLDLTRGTLWGMFSPLIPPKHCPGVISVAAIPPGVEGESIPPSQSQCARRRIPQSLDQ